MAQFSMTPNGMLTQEGETYVVIIAQEDQDNLYKKSLTYLNGIFNAPNHAISGVENKSITVNGFSENAIESKLKRNFAIKYDLRYSITFEFKDQKVKCEINSWTAGPIVPKGNLKSFGTHYGVYNENLDIQDQRAKESIEEYFNWFLSEFELSVLKSDDW